ncbi:DUF2269 family protein [Spartinivicinus poritis]|uniref:DUF2269 domain-containing protein n=1 Tax=Spartinivicinus poritis TaxID=2994640 RepID=A0ABT5U524_9GAMM|nr:DUF2269 domain-containing protein [Spartinivicinus sp. A2-2]MDE1461450.1 DUF2269 domain-containing protein [Spartinivicinus sp. A2-2]
MAEYYLLLKLVHIISSTLLFGTGLGTAFYMWRADRSQNLNTIAITSQNVVLADWLFTTPAVIIQPVTGIWMLLLVGLPLTTSWVMASLVLYVITGLCWIPVVYIQIKIAKLAKAAVSENQPLPVTYRKLMTCWYSLGWPAFISVMAIFYLMVFKPTLW